MAAGKSECWCETVTISHEALERVPEEAKGKLCVCRKCGEALAANGRK
jgi:predicted SprT family Zn-dependent metalloprotease